MGWLRRRVPYDLYTDQKEEKTPYHSLSDGRIHPRDLEEKQLKETQRKVIDYQMRRSFKEEQKREKDRFISDPHPLDQVEIQLLNSLKELRTFSIVILVTTGVIALALLFVSPSFFISIAIILLTSLILSLLYYYARWLVKKNYEKRRENAVEGTGPSPSDWVVLGNRVLEICFSSESVIVPIHYLDIRSVERYVMKDSGRHKIRSNEKVELAMEPWKVKGALYSPNTPVENLILIKLSRELDLPSFIDPGLTRSLMYTPDVVRKKRTSEILISIRPDEISRFIETLRSKLDHRKEYEEGGYLDEWN